MRTSTNILMCAATAAAALTGATAANSASIVNGGFETCSGNCPTNLTPLSGGSGELSGWTISSGDGGNANAAAEWVTSAGGGWQASQGSYSIALSAANEGTLTQSIATKAGVTYDITFKVAGNPKNHGLTKNVGLDVGGATKIFSFVDESTSSSNMSWVTETYQFTATSGSTVLSLFNDNSVLFHPKRLRLFGLALDDVEIHTAAVPEPATWAMMILGMAGLGGAARARRRAAFAVAV